MRRRSSCSGCWILPQPEQARLHWNSGSSSTISGNFSRLARRWRIRYHAHARALSDRPPLAYLSPPGPSPEARPRSAAQRARRRSAPPTACGRNSSWLGLSSTTRTTAKGRPAAPAASHARLHVDRQRARRAQLLAPLAGGDLADADDRALRARSGRRRAARRRAARRRRSRRARARGLRRRPRQHLLGDDHFARARLRVEAAAEAEHEQRLRPARARAARRPRATSPAPSRSCARARRARPSGSAPARTPAARHDDLAGAAPRSPPRGRGGRLELASARLRAAACPLITAPSSVAGQPVSVQLPASTSPGTSVSRTRAQAALPGAARNVAACSRVTRKRSTRAARARAAARSSAGR